MLAVRVDTLPAGLVPQLDSLVITGRHDEPSIRGEPGSGRTQVTRPANRHHGRPMPPPTATFPHCPLPGPGHQCGYMSCCDPRDPGQVASPCEMRPAQEAPHTACVTWRCVLTAGALGIRWSQAHHRHHCPVLGPPSLHVILRTEEQNTMCQQQSGGPGPHYQRPVWA